MTMLDNDLKKDGWVAVHLKPNGMQIAEQNLQLQRFEYFSPKLKRTERRFGKFRSSAEPLFPGYLFVKAGYDPAAWRNIDNTFGIARIVRNGLKPSFIQDGLVNALKANCDTDSNFKYNLVAEIGAKVKVISGPFASIVATVGQLEKDGRIKLLFEQLSRKAQFWTSSEDIVPA